jgi:carbonic anhydrase
MTIDQLAGRARTFPERISDQRAYFHQLASGQAPAALFITCSDSRVVPALITDAKPGELFELRTAGGVVPPYRPGRSSGELATIEYAVDALGVPDIVLCGHSHCGAVAAMAYDGLAALPVLRDWLTGTGQPVSADPDRPREPEAGADPTLRPLVERHILAQLDSLRRFPPVARRLSAGRLRLHAWFYQIDTGAVRIYREGTFRAA